MDKNILYQERLFSAILNNVHDGIIAIDQNLLIMFINRAAERMSGWTNEEAEGNIVSRVFNLIESQNLFPLIPGGLPRDENPQLFRNVILKSHNGETFIVEGSITKIQSVDDNGLPGYVMVFRDTSEMKKLSAAIDFQASHDTLTGLFNRESFVPKLQEILEDLQRNPGSHVLLGFDIDQYQQICQGNEVVAGDELLREVAGIIHSHIQRGDISARFRDDIFAVILRDCTIEEAVRVAERLRETVRDFQFSSGGISCRISLSMGLLALTDAYTDPMDVLQGVDQACSEAKQQGGDRLVVYGSSFFRAAGG
ncbi:MAG: diguanylate cyclase [Spirochaetaceae bacterium]|jgi:diguanylate cyclase (GGDEF)-like protein/PAS domain S-box-containing protein|nr:diguanylate cyclase [Spirochaetaceae bacterium]